MNDANAKIKKLLSFYRHGHLLKSEVLIELCQIVDAQNVDEVMSSVPPELLELVREEVERPRTGKTRIIGSEITEAESARLGQKIDLAIPLLKSWFASSG